MKEAPQLLRCLFAIGSQGLSELGSWPIVCFPRGIVRMGRE
jgi:hypothetical protein